MSSINQNSKFSKFFILGLVVLATVIPAVWLMAKNQQPKSLVSPLPTSETVANYKEEQKSISYYITTSQEFLNKARSLANNPTSPGLRGEQQTPEEKQTIIAMINQALDLVNQAIVFYPNDGRGFSQRAYLYQTLIPFLPESVNFAIQDLKEAIKLNPQNPQYHLSLAELYLKKGDFENSALAFYNAYLLSPTEVQIIYNLADTLEKSGQLQKANHYFEKLISLLPPENENLGTIRNRQQQLETVLAQSNLKYLTKPGDDLAPQAAVEEKIIGTQELPLKQAAIASNLIIANPEEKANLAKETSTLAISAKSGTSIISSRDIETTIKNNYVANDKQIILMPISDTENKVLFLKAKKAADLVNNQPGWFKVGIDKPISYNLEFKWWIID